MEELELDDKAYTKYRGRKFLITAATIALTTGLAYFGKMNGDVAMVFAAAIGSFNYALRNSG